VTAEAFERLLYTDCRAGTGRGAGGGFQVQAQSSGVDVTQSRMAVSWLLYEAQNAWIMERRPVADFPLGLAHASAAGFGTAQSRYVGQEATGGRQGNHLADCILTRDPGRYGPTRPAQLWRSELWRAEPWDSPDCPPLDGEPAPGPLTIDALTGWARDRPGRAAILERLLSVLEDPAGRRVVIVATGPDEAVTWIAAATLLLPARLALEISFKVFCVNPVRAEQRIVAVPRELNAQVAPGGGGSVFVLDADQLTSDEAEVSQRARFLVGQLAGAADPYDVVDAVELAETLGAAGKPIGADTILTAWAVTQPASPLPDPAALYRWLGEASLGLLAEHGGPVAARILEADPSAEVLRFLDDAATAGRLGFDPMAMRGRLLSAELAAVRAGHAVPHAPLVEVALDFDARRDAESELSTALLLGSDRQVSALLQLARRHGIEPDLAAVADRLYQFALHWLDDAAADYDPATWACGAEVLDYAHDELQARLTRRGPAAVLGPLQRLHPYLADRADDPESPLSGYLQAAAVATAPAWRRPAELRALLERMDGLPDPAAGQAAVQAALLGWDAVGPDEAFAVLDSLHGSAAIDPQIVDIAYAELHRRAHQPDERLLDLLADLDRHGLARLDGALASLRADDKLVSAFVEATRDGRQALGTGHAKLQGLAAVSPAVLAVRLESVLAVCVAGRRLDLAPDLLRVIPPKQRRPLLEAWARLLRGGEPASAAAWGLEWIMDPDLSPRHQTLMIKAIRGYGEKLGPADRDGWFLDVQSLIPADQADNWYYVSGYEPPRPRRGLHLRGRDGR
jgi:GTPase-associated protein 1, N-terminal domain type 2/GTPase-associated protein 1, middle domain